MNLNQIASKISIFRYIFNKWRETSISLHKTLFFNFSAFDFSTALKTPVWIYQKTKLEHVGKIRINGSIKSGMIRIGKRQFFRNSETSIINVGTMELDGNSVILGGSTIHVLGENSIIHFDK